jgi:hypothetical protein
MTDLENKWYKYVCSKYPFLTWRVEFNEHLMCLIFECKNLNFRCGRYKFPISYYYTDDFKEYVQSQARDSLARKEITKYVKDIKELCKRGLKCKIKS